MYFVFFKGTAAPQINTSWHTLSLHNALPISRTSSGRIWPSFFPAKGFDERAARRRAGRLTANPGEAVDMLAREELGIDPSDPGGSPRSAAASSFGQIGRAHV